jgi:hypothetical protein
MDKDLFHLKRPLGGVKFTKKPQQKEPLATFAHLFQMTADLQEV